MPSQHARLSPSASERWLGCPASIRMAEQVPGRPATSSYAEEGTAAHELGEIKANIEIIEGDDTSWDSASIAAAFRSWREKYPFVTDEMFVEMDRHTNAYVELLRERLGREPNSVLFLEQRLDTGVPTCWGTSDAVIASPTHVEIVDFKYGAGVRVDPEGNPQLRLYALGALDTYGDVLGDTQVIYMTVHQPRIGDGHVRTAEMHPDDLRAWRQTILPIADEALSEGSRFGPSDEACRWCPASGRCKAQLEAVFAVVDDDPETLTPEQIAETLPRLPMVTAWLKTFEEAALTMSYAEGVTIPGYKVVLSGGKRVITDHDGALETLQNAGFNQDQVAAPTALKGIGALEKLLGKEQFAELLKDHVRRTDGRPSLVLESDRRTPISPASEAAKDFKEES